MHTFTTFRFFNFPTVRGGRPATGRPGSQVVSPQRLWPCAQSGFTRFRAAGLNSRIGSSARNGGCSPKASSAEERSMQLNGLADAGASVSERARFVAAMKAAQNQDGSWSQLSVMPAGAYATGETLYALHVSGAVSPQDPVYRKGVQWLLRNQLADGSWFVPTRAVP